MYDVCYVLHSLQSQIIVIDSLLCARTYAPLVRELSCYDLSYFLSFRLCAPTKRNSAVMDPMGFTTIAMIKEHGNSCERIHEEGRTSKRNFKGWSGGVGCFLFEWRRYIAFRSEKDELGSAPVHFGWNNEFHSLFEEESTAKLDISTGQRLLRFM